MVTVLVVDDDHQTRSLLSDALQCEGYDPIVAADGVSGLQLAEENAPDLIISDINMPGFDGIRMLERIRQIPSIKTVPVIFLTGEGDTSSLRTGMLTGAEDYLVKPVSVADLLSSVKVQLRKRAALVEQHNTTLSLLRRSILYALPHELRTPLHAISGYAQLLVMDQGMSSPEDIIQSAQSIVAASERLGRLFENYLVFAQLELIYSSQKELEAARNHLVRDCAAIIEAAAIKCARSHGRTNDLQLDLCHLALRISEPNLAKIISELVDNALKFSQPGQPVIVRSIRDHDLLKIFVIDQGRGMTPEDIALVGMYLQFGRELYEQQGLGLGFTIAKRLVELHSGVLKVESQVGRGTTVAIRFPLY